GPWHQRLTAERGACLTARVESAGARLVVHEQASLEHRSVTARDGKLELCGLDKGVAWRWSIGNVGGRGVVSGTVTPHGDVSLGVVKLPPAQSAPGVWLTSGGGPRITTDEIVTVNGRPAEALTSLERRSLFRAPKTVLRARVDGVVRTVTVAAASLR